MLETTSSNHAEERVCFLLYADPFKAGVSKGPADSLTLAGKKAFQVHGKPFNLNQRQPSLEARDRVLGKSLCGIRTERSEMDEGTSRSALGMAAGDVVRFDHLSCGLGT